ncbi:glycoside hydrolase family 92 protein, partial [Pseudocercospora fijiensis CIRAD86]
LKFVNPKIGTFGITPNGNGGMIPSVGMPFGMTRWVAQTRENFISQCPYHEMDGYIHGFQATHQPAIWMGESGQVVICPGVGEVETGFVKRGRRFFKRDEVSTPHVYEVEMEAVAVEGDWNLTEMAMTATSHVGRLLVDFSNAGSDQPYVFVQATRKNWTGSIFVDEKSQEISGSNPQRQDSALGPLRADGFSGYFVSRFSEPFESFGVANAEQKHDGKVEGKGDVLGAYVKFAKGTRYVEVRTGVSFVSIEQARANLEIEAPARVTFAQAVDDLKNAWLEKLGRVTIEGVNKTDGDHDQRTIWYTGLFHALQYPSDFSEPFSKGQGKRTYYSGYTDSVHSEADSYYQSWSIWDTFRAEHSLLTMFAPERVNSMMRSLVKIYDWAGRLPMWANVVETNIMIGTHVDAVLANALARGFKDFDVKKAWEGVKKNAYEPPINDTELLYYDREAYTPDEVRAGLTTYLSKGYVANDRWSESASRTLDYAFDDHAAAIVAQHAGDEKTAAELHKRSMNYRNIYNSETGFMEAKNDNGTWAGSEQGWAEGDDWIYTFNVMHDPLGLAKLMGSRAKMRSKLDEYFGGGHNDHSNEPSHHAPYLYSAIGYPGMTATLVRDIAAQNYNATAAGLSGNEDLGQMSAWYIFSAMGFYPVNPASDEYIVGAPFFEKLTIRFPSGAATGGIGGEEHTLTISAPGAPTKPYVKGLKVDGKAVKKPVLRHGQILTAERIEFDMSEQGQQWGM